MSDDPRAVVRPGRYQLELASFDLDGYPLNPRQVAGRLERVAVVAKHPARGGVVDLTLHLAPETGLTDVDGGDPFVRGMLGRFEELMRAKVGVSLGQVAVKMLPSDAGADVGTLADSRALWARFGEATPRQRPINVMTVAKLGFAAGVSGNSPGAPGVYGRPTSGVTLQPLGSGARSTGTLLSHEVLHYLGLFHTSDAFFGADYLTDTPYCEDTTAGGCPDARNLMFPFFPTGDPLTITSGQAKVVEGSPWVYRWVHPGACGADTEVVGLTNPRWASGNTRGAPSKLQGACGGTGGEVVYLYRLEAAAQRLKVTATATDFTPVLYVRRATCSGNEVACVAAEANQAVATVDNPVAGAYFIVVDSASDGGVYDVDVTVTP